MYATCLFCNSTLGSNEALEHFPVGRRLAYDQSRGRLWVVCRRCERWNLSPLEARWEAIEEAERAFRATRQRIATDNIALARLNDGLELVRIGAPPRLELATWRYGDQFGRRRRKHIAYLGLGLAIPALPFLGQFGVGAALLGFGAVLTHVATDMRSWWRDSKVPTVFLTGDTGAILPLTKHDTWTAALVPVQPYRGVQGRPEWYLRVHHRVRDPEDPLRPRFLSAQAVEPARLKGIAAHRALATLLPHANATGGNARRIREAVGVIESSSSLNQLVYDAATINNWHVMVQSNPLTGLPAPVRLAMEMVVHEDDERRAMEGELAVLEERWRGAEEIAAIANALLVPADTEARVEALRRKKE